MLWLATLWRKQLTLGQLASGPGFEPRVDSVAVSASPPLSFPQDFHCVLVMAILGAMLVAALLAHAFLLPFHGPTQGENVAASPCLDDPCRDPCR